MQLNQSLKNRSTEHLTGLAPQDTGIVVVDLGHIQHNYDIYRNLMSPTKIIPVLKANAYGLGLKEVLPALIQKGVNEVFLATIDEGITIKQHFPTITPYVLDGLYGNTAQLYLQHQLVPVCNSLQQIKAWRKISETHDTPLEAVIHIDTGMSRTGLCHSDSQCLIAQPHHLRGLHIRYLMSHLACSEDSSHPLNKQQLQAFNRFSRHFPGIPTSLAASTALKYRSEWHCDMARIGYGLFGFTNFQKTQTLRPALSVYARVIQLRTIAAGCSAGYAASFTASRTTRLATIAMGYADGYHRFLHDYDTAVYFGPHRAPLAGRISMDFCVADVTDVPERYIYEGAWAEIIGENMPVDKLIKNTQFIPHEVPIHLGPRLKRYYII